MEDKSNIKPDWVKYYIVESYEWDCPICEYINKISESPRGRILRCLKCGSYFDKIIEGGVLIKE